MNEQRKDILDMLAEGKITAEEAEQLIAALDRDQPSAASALDIRPNGKAKFLRVEVDAIDDGVPTRINVRVPLQLLRPVRPDAAQARTAQSARGAPRRDHRGGRQP